MASHFWEDAQEQLSISTRLTSCYGRPNRPSAEELRFKRMSVELLTTVAEDREGST